MLNITVDVYSGRPNPTFTLSDQETRDILKEIALHKRVITSFDVVGSNLGYRGINISSQSENLLHYYGLPPSFSIANGLSMFESKGREIAERLLRSPSVISASYFNNYSISPPLTNWILKEIKDMPIISFPKYEPENERIGCQYEQVAFEPHIIILRETIAIILLLIEEPTPLHNQDVLPEKCIEKSLVMKLLKVP
ncbi:hypothetical protein OCF65_28240 [Bacillus toyonensis]|uniref:hypothetical protein n=1 Tax=Bacillus toyonensis TaxID=155322 RepID=UPI0021CE53E8|nr:hypothetical protein [Bacillus toyonensis]MCU5584258.1 hypothetical protein [Bacillus toyonensis]